VSFSILLQNDEIRAKFGPLFSRLVELLTAMVAEVSAMHDIKTPNTINFIIKVEELAGVIFKLHSVYKRHREGFLKSSGLRWCINSLVVSLAVVVISLA
jgi:hypothetical protein